MASASLPRLGSSELRIDTRGFHLARWLVSGVLLSAVVCIAVIVRWRALGTPALTNDEAFSWCLAQYPVADVLRRVTDDAHPPLFYLALKLWLTVWGSSPLAVRSLSATFGVLSVGMVYLLCWDAVSPWPGRTAATPRRLCAGALLAAFLMAVGTTDVSAGRSGRMYGLGIFLACLSSWLLLKALRSPPRRLGWWLAYALAAAAFCYTHYYAFFTLAAHAVFVGVALLPGWRLSTVPWQSVAARAVLAAALVCALYAPWVPFFWAQVGAVRETFWITPVTPSSLERVLFSWATGCEDPGPLAAGVWLVLTAAVAVCAVWRGGPAGLFFCLLALLPWLGSIGFSTLSGRPIVLGRYFVFAHVGLLGLWAVAWERFRGLGERAFLVGLLVPPCLFGLWQTFADIPDGPPAVAQAARALAQDYRPGDVVLVESPGDLTIVRYYAARAGLPHLEARCVVRASGGGHVSHLAALAAAEAIPSEDALFPLPAGRLWRAGTRYGGWLRAPRGMEEGTCRYFAGSDGTQYFLILYREAPAPKQDRDPRPPDRALPHGNGSPE